MNTKIIDKRKVVKLTGRGARGPIGLDVLTPEAERAGKLVQFVTGGNGRRVVGVAGGGADNTLRGDLAGSLGAYLVTLGVRTIADKLDEVVSIADFPGADPTGATDSAGALRAAMAKLKTRGGGVLRLPAGRWFLNSGDPRGFDWGAVSGVAGSFYTICEAVPNVTVRGEGDATVLVVDPQRLGRNNSGTNLNRLDAGAIFANFRVSTPEGNNPTPVAFFQLLDIKAEWLPVIDQSYDVVEGHLLRIESNGGAIANGTVIVENVTALNDPGHQIINAGRIDFFSARNIRIVNPGKASNAGNKDHSCFFISGSTAIVTGCSVRSPFVTNNTFLELHCQTNIVQENTAKGLATFCNAVSQIIHPGPAYDHAVFLVHNNVAEGISAFVTDYCYGQNRKRLLSIKNNIILFATPTSTITEYVHLSANDSGLAPADILPTARLVIESNNIECLNPEVPIAAISQSNTLIQPSQAVDVTVQRNRFTNIRRGIFSTFSAKTKRLRVAENEVRGGCLQGLSDTDGTLRTSRTLFYAVAPPGYAWEAIEFVRNRLQNSYQGAAEGYGIIINNQTGATLAASIELVDNDIELISPGKELSTITSGSSAWAIGCVHIRHEWRRDFGVDPYSRVTLNGFADSIKPGSEGRFRTATTRVVFDGTSNSFPTELWGDTLPATGFYHRGSTMRLLSVSPGGYMMKICTTAGVLANAVWKGAGLIEANSPTSPA